MSVITTNQTVIVETLPGRRAMKMRTQLEIGCRLTFDRRIVGRSQITKHLSTGQPTLRPTVRSQSN